jgi:hypothetical protein
MKEAKSLYFGGRKITADESLSYSSYKDLGLLCCYCGEPVFIKTGFERENHFAHFSSIDPDRFRKCKLRQKNKDIFYCPDKCYQAEGRKQNIEIFNKHFLDIVLRSNSELLCVSSSSSQRWEDKQLFKKCKDSFSRSKSSTLKFYKLVPESQSLMHRQIASEALDYLCSYAGDKVFQELSQMAYRNLLYSERNRAENSFKLPIKAENINRKIAEIVFSTSWVEYLSGLDYLPCLDKEDFEKPDHLIEALNDSTHAHIYAIGSSIFYGVFRDYQVKQESKVIQINFEELRRSNGIKQIPRRKIQEERWPLSIISKDSPNSHIEHVESAADMLRSEWRQWIINPTQKGGRYVVKRTFKRGISVSFDKDIKTFDKDRFALALVNGKVLAKLEFFERIEWNFSVPQYTTPTQQYFEVLSRHPGIEDIIFNKAYLSASPAINRCFYNIKI